MAIKEIPSVWWEFNQEKVDLKRFLETKLTKLDDPKTRSDLEWLINEVNMAQSKEELTAVEAKLEQTKDAEIMEFLRNSQQKKLSELQKSVLSQPDVTKMDEHSLRKLADKWRKQSASVIHSDLRDLQQASWKWSVLSWIIEKAA